MTALALLALASCAAALLTQAVTAAIVIWRSRTAPTDARATTAPAAWPFVSIVRPVCGLDPHDGLTLRSTFTLATDNYEILFCAAHANDAAVPLVRALIAEYPGRAARLLIGDEKPTANPKLNNIVKGWRAARAEWIVLADSNVLMPPNYLDILFAAHTPGTGLVCSPPVGSRPDGFAAEIECAFLNGYQARWQCAADAIGFGFAQGKSMLWRRELLDRAGGIIALGSEIAEDAAATKIVRAQGLQVRLVPLPFEQPLGPRRIATVWHRQVRWARLRRATFPAFYAPEILTGSVLPITAGAFGAHSLDISPSLAFATLIAFWYGTEAIVTRAAGWHMSRLAPFAWLARDLMLPLLWAQGWSGNSFTWRGNAMTVSAAETSDGAPARA